MDIRLLAVDLDGTLLPSTKQLSNRTREAVRRASAAGVRVLIATGKTFNLAARYAEALSLTGPVIALDGAYVRDWPGGPVRTDVRVSRDRLAGMLRALDGLPLLPFLADSRDRLILHRGLGPYTRFLSAYSARLDMSADPLADTEGDPWFCGLLGSPEAVRSGRGRLAPYRGDGVAVMTADFFVPELGMLLLRSRETKGAALARVAADLGIPLAGTAAVGDWTNDLEMLDVAGLAVAMPGSDPAVISAADLVLPFGPEEDGIARWLEEIV
jgi:Cof subfamily protein (haloacid dehalogenase superfamily)